MSIPSILGTKASLESWNDRRVDVLSLFEEYEYGKIPKISFDNVKLYHNEHLELEGGYVKDTYGLIFIKAEKYCGMQYEVFFKKGLKKPAPSILHINPFSSNPIGYMRNVNDSNLIEMFPVTTLADKGFIAVNCCVDKLCADDVRTWMYGIMEIEKPLGDNGWCAIGAWAWATSRIIDQILKDPKFDPKRIVIAGCSRAGKTALWCGANDQRIAAVFASVSGCCGAAMHRGKTGETIEKITNVFPHWSCQKFKEFKGKEYDLPMDQHMLLALIAPRPLYITSASKDSWADPEKEFESCVLVSELYEKMGYRGLGSSDFPKVNEPLKQGRIAYHIRDGEHGCKIYDWEQVLPFLVRELKI